MTESDNVVGGFECREGSRPARSWPVVTPPPSRVMVAGCNNSFDSATVVWKPLVGPQISSVLRTSKAPLTSETPSTGPNEI